MNSNSLEREQRLQQVIVSRDTSIKEAMRLLDRAGTGALLLCYADRKLYGILTDGDIRRAILQDVPLDQPCRDIASPQPIVAAPEIAPLEALHLMDEFDIHHLPVVDEAHRVVDFVMRRDLVAEDQLPLSAVIMAGGFGTRLMPLTEELPKPMLPVGDRPLMARIIERLRASGIRRVNVTTHYQPEKITDYFGDGQAFGVELSYVAEDRPLGTAGALGLMAATDQPLLLINGDILTRVDFRAMLKYHRDHQADMTVGVRQYDLQIPYGVLECEGGQVRRLREKPTFNFLVNAGVYLLQPLVRQYIPAGQRFDMTDLMQSLLDDGRTVVSFPIVEYWLDIGQHTDYQKAQEDVKNGRL